MVAVRIWCCKANLLEILEEDMLLIMKMGEGMDEQNAQSDAQTS